MARWQFFLSLSIFFAVIFKISLAQGNSIDWSTGCPTNFERLGKKCYFVSYEQLNWFGADAACRRLNAELLTIENENEMNLINDYLVSKNHYSTFDTPVQRFWTSANDNDKKHVWVWQSNGKLVDYLRFAQGEPNDLYDEHCINIEYKGKTPRFEMNDLKCEKTVSHVCEIKSELSF